MRQKWTLGQCKTLGLTRAGYAVFDLPPFQNRVGLPPLQIHENSNGRVSKIQAFEIASSNVDHLLGLGAEGGNGEIDLGTLVATKGGDLLSFEGKVVAVLQRELGITHLF